MTDNDSENVWEAPLASLVPDEKTVDVAEELPSVREKLSLSGKVSWVLIVLMTIAMVSLTAMARQGEGTRTVATVGDLFEVQMQGKVTVGQKALLEGLAPSVEPTGGDDSDGAEADSDPSAADSAAANSAEDGDGEPENIDDESSSDQSETRPVNPATQVPAQLNAGTYEQRLCFVLLVNENQGSDAAAEELEDLDKQAVAAEFEPTEEQEQLRDCVGRLIEEQQAGNFESDHLTDEEQALLAEKLGWIGELALVPEGTSQTAARKAMIGESRIKFIVATLFGLTVGCSMFAGFVALVTLSIMFSTAKLRPLFKARGHGLNIYIETFAVWMFVFFVLPQLTALGLRFVGVEIAGIGEKIFSLLFFWGSLVALGWPVFRGIPFSQVLQDIGWKTKSPLKETLLSPLTYVAGLPLMIIAGGLAAGLSFLASLLSAEKEFGTSVAAGHPIQEMLSEAGFVDIMFVVVMACVAAPIVEETFFRGVLYRHLRELTAGKTRLFSVLFSGLFNGFVFAAIHPQGFVAIPLLATLALSFSLAREWRDSLWASMCMHAINNGAITVLMVCMVL